MSMNVELLYHTPEPERAIAAAARLCYAPVGAAELLEAMSDEQQHSVLRTILRSGHTAALEHASYTYAVDGVSRAMTHQLVRHRLASYNQQSQRYVNYDEPPQFIVPPSVDGAGGADADGATANADAARIYADSCASAFDAYRALIDAGVPKEDARYVLPNAMETKIVITMNVRELLHFFSLRCCERAQWEIRNVANAMLEAARPTAPYIFLDAGSGCLRGPCPEGKMTCGHPRDRVVRK